jgi:hypothetical protein
MVFGFIWTRKASNRLALEHVPDIQVPLDVLPVRQPKDVFHQTHCAIMETASGRSRHGTVSVPFSVALAWHPCRLV